jgi:hypothetical protein
MKGCKFNAKTVWVSSSCSTNDSYCLRFIELVWQVHHVLQVAAAVGGQFRCAQIPHRTGEPPFATGRIHDMLAMNTCRRGFGRSDSDCSASAIIFVHRYLPLDQPDEASSLSCFQQKLRGAIQTICLHFAKRTRSSCSFSGTKSTESHVNNSVFELSHRLGQSQTWWTTIPSGSSATVRISSDATMAIPTNESRHSVNHKKNLIGSLLD